MDLNIVWYVLIGVLFAGYAMLDGFDLGVGILHVLHKGDEARRISLNSIGPVWDGNEVWLVTGGGALFAAFPEVYATVFSGFYLALILLLFALVFRAVAIEMRSKLPMPWWRGMWDWSFSIASFVAPLLFGVALGNMVLGIPLDADHNFTGGFFSLLRPYALLMGVTTVALFAMHGSIFLCMKTDGAVHEQVRQWVNPSIVVFTVCYAALTVATIFYVPHIARTAGANSFLVALAILSFVTMAIIPREISKKHDGHAFVASMATIALLMSLFAVGMFPTLVLSSANPSDSLTIYNAASSDKTLFVMLVICLIGMPMVATYTISIYWIFRGKVKLTPTSY